MPRSLEEWVGKNDDTPVPPRVRLRVFIKFDGVCGICGGKIAGKAWICDHKIALINGGENRETNLQPIHVICNKSKTADDVALKSKVYESNLRRVGIKKRKSKWKVGRESKFKKKLDGTVVLRSGE